MARTIDPDTPANGMGGYDVFDGRDNRLGGTFLWAPGKYAAYVTGGAQGDEVIAFGPVESDVMNRLLEYLGA